MDTQTALVTPSEIQPIVDLVIDGLNSDHSKRAYSRALSSFLRWWDASGRPALVKAVVLQYKVDVLDRSGLAASSVNLAMSAIRKLASEAADNGLMDPTAANGIGKIKGVRSSGVRSGNWLTKAQAEELLRLPDNPNLLDLRNRAILAVMVGAGLRRSEVAALDYSKIVQREGRWVIIDLTGKGGRVRTVPVSSWVKVCIDAWSDASGVTSGRVFRGVYHYGLTLQPESAGITSQAIFYAVQSAALAAYKRTGDPAFLTVAPHDLRRTFAKLAHKGGAGLDQIQLTLGHASIKTTERYLGVAQDLTNAPCDCLGLELAGD